MPRSVTVLTTFGVAPKPRNKDGFVRTGRRPRRRTRYRLHDQCFSPADDQGSGSGCRNRGHVERQCRAAQQARHAGLGVVHRVWGCREHRHPAYGVCPDRSMARVRHVACLPSGHGGFALARVKHPLNISGQAREGESRQVPGGRRGAKCVRPGSIIRVVKSAGRVSGHVPAVALQLPWASVGVTC